MQKQILRLTSTADFRPTQETQTITPAIFTKLEE